MVCAIRWGRGGELHAVQAAGNRGTRGVVGGGCSRWQHCESFSGGAFSWASSKYPEICLAPCYPASSLFFMFASLSCLIPSDSVGQWQARRTNRVNSYSVTYTNTVVTGRPGLWLVTSRSTLTCCRRSNHLNHVLSTSTVCPQNKFGNLKKNPAHMS